MAKSSNSNLIAKFDSNLHTNNDKSLFYSVFHIARTSNSAPL